VGKVLAFETKAARALRLAMARYVAWKRDSREHHQRLLQQQKQASERDSSSPPGAES
jgi:hypothetical protein